MGMIFWFLIMLLDMICTVGFSINLIMDFTVLRAFIVACFVVSGILAVSIFKDYVKNFIRINKKLNKAEIISLRQLNKN